MLALTVAFALQGTVAADSAYACSCGTPTPERALQRSDAVFAGEVLSVEAGELARGPGPPSLGKVLFEPSKVWKGEPRGPAVVYGQGAGAMCGLNFEKGEGYLVYAYRGTKDPDSPLHTGLCSRTNPLEGAVSDLRALGAPVDRLPQTGGFPTPRTVAIVAGAALGVIAAGSLLVRPIRPPAE